MKLMLSLSGIALTLAACASGGPEPFHLDRNTEFDGETLRVFVTLREDGRFASVSTPDDVIDTRPAKTPIPGHTAQDWTFFRHTEEGDSIAYSLVSWDPDNPADYLMAGWWAEFHGGLGPEPVIWDAERWALVDGPEIDHGIIPQLPASGTASYAGTAGGLYQYEFGSDWGENAGKWVIDEYEGIVTLTADFMDGSLRGCIGCVGDLVTRRAHFGVILGADPIDMEGVAKDYELHLGTALYRDDGMFERGHVTVVHPEREIVEQEGWWAGALSSKPDADGAPRLVAGFGGADYEEADDSWGEFFGSFIALSGAFREAGDGG